MQGSRTSSGDMRRFSGSMLNSEQKLALNSAFRLMFFHVHLPCQTTSTMEDHKAIDGSNGIDADKASTAANKVSEELLTCLLAIFSQKSTSSNQDEERVSPPSASGSGGVS